MPPTARLILHGKQASNDAVRDQVKALRAQGLQLDVRVTWEAGDGVRYANEAADGGIDLVLAGGGDGTLNEIAGALAERAAPADALPVLAALPLGTANDFATAAGVSDDVAEAIAQALAAPVHAIDLVHVQCDGVRRWFVNVATGGFGTEVTTETPEELKRSLGRVAYLLTGLTRFGSLRSAHGRFEVPAADGAGAFCWEGEFLTLGIGNARLAGGGHALCPDALLDDGLVDLAILPAPGEGALLEVLGTLFRNGRAGMDDDAIRARVPELRIHADQGMTLNLDGEPLEGTDFHVRVAPGRLRMALQRACPLLQAR